MKPRATPVLTSASSSTKKPPASAASATPKIADYQASIRQLKYGLSASLQNQNTQVTSTTTQQKENRNSTLGSSRDKHTPHLTSHVKEEKPDIKQHERQALTTKVKQLESVCAEKINTLKSDLKKNIQQETEFSRSAIKHGCYRPVSSTSDQPEYLMPLQPRIQPLSWERPPPIQRTSRPWWHDNDSVSRQSRSSSSDSDDDDETTAYGKAAMLKRKQKENSRRISLYSLSNLDAFKMLKSNRSAQSSIERQSSTTTTTRTTPKCAGGHTTFALFEKNFRIVRAEGGGQGAQSSNNKSAVEQQQQQQQLKYPKCSLQSKLATRRTSLFLNQSVYDDGSVGVNSVKSAACTANSNVISSQLERYSSKNSSQQDIIGHFSQNGSYFASKNASIEGNIYGKTKKKFEEIDFVGGDDSENVAVAESA